MLDRSNALAQFFALNTFHIGQHAFFTKVALRQVIGRQCCRVIGRQSDQVVEDSGFASRVALKVSRPLIRKLTQFGIVILNTHQLVAVVLRYILAV